MLPKVRRFVLLLCFQLYWVWGGGALQGTVDPVVYGNQLLGLDTEHAVDGKVKDVLKDYTFYIVPRTEYVSRWNFPWSFTH